ncbi:hypothetical protein ABPG72_015337 [Tetrahymena utriculariae]
MRLRNKDNSERTSKIYILQKNTICFLETQNKLVRATTLKLLLIISLASLIRGEDTCDNYLILKIWNDIVQKIEVYFENDCWNGRAFDANVLQISMAYANSLPNTVFQSFYLESLDINGQPYVQLNNNTPAFLSFPKGSFGEFPEYIYTFYNDLKRRYPLFIKNNEYYTELDPTKMISIPDVLQKPAFNEMVFYSSDETHNQFILVYINDMRQISTMKGVSLTAPILSFTHDGQDQYFIELQDGKVIESHLDKNSPLFNKEYFSQIISPPPIVSYTTKDRQVFKLNYRTYSVFYYSNSSTYSEQIPYGPDVYLCKELKFDLETSFAKYYENKTMVISHGNSGQHFKQYTQLPINYDYAISNTGHNYGQYFILYKDKVEYYQFDSYQWENEENSNQNPNQNIVLTTYALDQADIGKFSVVKYYNNYLILTSMDGMYTSKVYIEMNLRFDQKMMSIQADRQLLNKAKPTQMYFDYILRFGNEQQGNPIRFRLNNPYGSNDNPGTSGGMILTFHYKSFFQIILIFITLSKIIRNLLQ